MKRIFKLVMILLVLSSNIGCDRISKNVAWQKLEYHKQVEIITNHLTLIKVENTGAFLSLGHSWPQPVKTLLLTIIPLIAFAIAILCLLTRDNLPAVISTGICFIVGGGFGNIYDRIVYGTVTDFLHLDFGIFRTGIFNMADVSVMTGALLILAGSYFSRRKLDFKSIDKQGE